MKAVTNCTRPAVSPDAKPPLDSAFSPEFLAKMKGPEHPLTAREALLAGSWEAEEISLEPGEGMEPGSAWAVVRRDEPMAQGGRAFAVFRDRDPALWTAAVLPSLHRPPVFHLKQHEGRLGHALHHGRMCLGHLAREEEGLLPRLELARALAADPEALALLLEAVGREALKVLGRVLARRV